MTSHAVAATADRLRVCLLVPYDLSPEGGGVKQHAVHLGAALVRCGDAVTVIGPASTPLDDAGMVGFGGVVSISGNGSDNRLGLLTSPAKVWRFFRSRPFDVLHIHEPQTPLLSYWASWAAPHIPQVATFHAYAESHSALLARKLTGKLLFKRMQRGIAVSEFAASYARDSWHRPLSIIPNGVPLNIFKPPQAPRARGPLRLLFVGRLADQRKGARVLIEAFRQMVAANCHTTLTMMGSHADFGELPKVPGLTFAGEVDLQTLAQAYREHDICVAPSTGQESFGIILLEAMASARPLVCSDIHGYRSTVHLQGARLVPPNDPTALAATLLELVAAKEEDLAAMGRVNLKHVRQFGWDSLTERIRSEYLAAIADHRGGG